MNAKRKINFFSAGCPAREETISRISDPACPSCDVVILDMKILMPRPTIWRGLLAAVLLATFWITPLQAQDAKPVYTLYADGLACPFCAYGIEKQLNAIEGVAAVETDLKAGTITITMQDGAALDEPVARKAVEAAGFTLRDFKREGGPE